MMLASLSQARDFGHSLGQRFGLAFLFLGVFLERPLMFACSILLLLMTAPFALIIERLIRFKIELLFFFVMIVFQLAADSRPNALILTLYLMGLINGLLLPSPQTIPPRSWISLALICLFLALFFTSELPVKIGLVADESIFGKSPENYQIDPRSLGYATYFIFFYLEPHFRRGLYSVLHMSLLMVISALGTNKFGVLYAALYKFAPRFVIPVVLSLFLVLATIGFSNLDSTASRAALWADFFANFPNCDSTYGICTELISLNNEEGVRSFHSIFLDFCWYGGGVGLLGGIYFLVRVAIVQSNFGGSAAVLFLVALLFGFPPFFNERHVLIIYALLVLFQADRPRHLAHWAL